MHTGMHKTVYPHECTNIVMKRCPTIWDIQCAGIRKIWHNIDAKKIVIKQNSAKCNCLLHMERHYEKSYRELYIFHRNTHKWALMLHMWQSCRTVAVCRHMKNQMASAWRRRTGRMNTARRRYVAGTMLHITACAALWTPTLCFHKRWVSGLEKAITRSATKRYSVLLAYNTQRHHMKL